MGQLVSGGASRPATSQDMELYERMRQQLAHQPVPMMQHRQDPHEYLFIALFDGTGQDVDDPAQLPTNVGVLSKRANLLERDRANNIGTHYVPGIGTQKNPMARLADGALAYTWDDRIKEMYHALAEQAYQWQEEDPQAKIRLVGVGYSRGAVLVPGLARLVDRYGIADPEHMRFGRDADGNLTVRASRTLIPPGQVAQAVGLFDPVATNMPRNYDARLPKSVLSGFSQIARDERRELFPHQTILDPDWSDDGRFLSVPVPGGHSNVGGGNREAGLESMAFNGMADYLNALTDRPLFEHRPVPDDPSQYTIFQARGATAAFGLRMDDDGQRNFRDELANCKIVDLCHDADPIDVSLARQFPWHEVTPAIAEPTPALPGRKSPSDLILDDYLAALRAGDEQGMSAAASAMAKSDYGRQRVDEAEQWELEMLQRIPGRDNPLFEQALHHLERLGPDDAGYWNRTEMEQMAGSISYEAQHRRMPAIDELYPVRGGEGLAAIWKHPSNTVLDSFVIVDKMQAMAQPLEQSLQGLAEEAQRQEQMSQIQALQRDQQQSIGMSR
ncbi:hypothetical protein J2T07_003024 [Luteibacter jiangsuensis]|uniref:Alpha/beta hydrolase family protein DUF2235 n=1 Tax=Luteibacter jiangsuensis TaxID=637577 RepID=A0ABT9T0M6_9GAMM|nr:DUF2235 domain-containing protein [Luteibacter jiangsuensis]MDQ0010818.1 hypothetical protein [Luteibacter jiangsuensis]